MPTPLWPILDRRDRRPERMDDPALLPEDHRAALAGLAAVNRVSRAAPAMLRAVLDLAGGRPVRALDLGCGGGDVAVELAHAARRRGARLRVFGADRSPFAVAASRDLAARTGVEAGFFVLDALRDPLPHGYDLLLASLFLHHLDDGEARGLLARMAAAARIGIVVSDLERNRPGYAAAVAGTRLLTRSPVVREDGPLSVRAAFTAGEMSELARRAGLRGARIRRSWPFRLTLVWRRA